MLDIELFTEIDDFAFGVVNYFQSDYAYKSGNKITVLEIDDLFLEENELIDGSKQLNKNYNDFFPRKYLIEVIEKLDTFQPKLLFIDLDLSKSKEPSVEKELIELLHKHRTYPIYFTHNLNDNFIKEKQINGIKFVSSGIVANHNKVRHYQAYKQTNIKPDKYYFGPLIFSGLLCDNSLSAIDSPYHIINNRFIYKDKFNEEGVIKSYWEDITFYSLVKLEELQKDLHGAIVFLGTTNINSHDFHAVYDGSKKPGVEILANALASIYYFSPQLKILPDILAILVTFIIAFIVRYCFLCLNKKSSIFNSLLFLFAIIFVNFLVSYLLIFKVYHLWLNYLTPYTWYIVMKIYCDFFNPIFAYIKTKFILLRE